MTTDWIDRARCRGAESEKFFARSLREAGPAIAVCERCRVQEACLQYALEHDIGFGVWGGRTERQRRNLQRRRQLASQP